MVGNGDAGVAHTRVYLERVEKSQLAYQTSPTPHKQGAKWIAMGRHNAKENKALPGRTPNQILVLYSD